MNETFGPEYVRPPAARKDCPHCPCCTEALCKRGATTILECLGCTAAPETRATVAGCPCSSEETQGTAAWRAGRLRVTLHALDPEHRLPEDQVEALRLIADLGDVTALPGQVLALTVRRYAAFVDFAPELTELGAVYLRALEEERVESAASVVSVDSKARTALVVVYAIGLKPVTVLVDQLLSATGLKEAELTGRPLVVLTNRPADLEDVVLTGIRLVPPPPDAAPVPDADAAEPADVDPEPADAEEEDGRVDDALSSDTAAEAPTAVIPVVAIPPATRQPIADTVVMPLAEAPLAATVPDGAP